jgi:predicted DNA-binding transcriptional regulator YafY
VDKKTSHLTGWYRKRRRWALFNKDRVKASQAKHYRLHKRKRILNVINWQKKNPEKVKVRVLRWQKSPTGKIKHNISSLKNYHKKKNIIQFLEMMNKPTNTFINVTL